MHVDFENNLHLFPLILSYSITSLSIYVCIYIYMYMLFKEKTINVLIKIFRLLPLSIHVNIYNLSVLHKII